nr:unnamed protein product [Leishmania braziliensis]
MEWRPNYRKAWVTGVVVVTALFALVVRRGQQKRRSAHQTTGDTTHDELAETLSHTVLPVLVRPEDLPAGWGVAPPVFYPPHCAAIPLVLPSEMHEVERHSCSARAGRTERSKQGKADNLAAKPTAFLFCSYAGCTKGLFTTQQDEEVLLAELLAHHPVLQKRLAENPGQWSPLPDAAPPAATDPESAAGTARERRQSSLPRTFSHVLVNDDYFILAGMNGPYIIIAVLGGFAGVFPSSLTARTPSRGEGSGRKRTGSATPATTAEGTGLSDVIEAIARATVSVPLVKLGNESSELASRTPGTSFAVHRGYYRVVYTREGQELELCVPSEWSVWSEYVTSSLTTPIDASSLDGKTVSTEEENAEPKEATLTLSFTPSSFMSESHVEICVSAELFSALLENPQAAAATLWAASAATDVSNPVAKATLGVLTGRPLPASSHGRTNVVTTVYVQPKFGVLFSVHPRSAVVYEPWLTDLPTILYYPLGDAVEDEMPPRMTIEYVVEMPKTWEVLTSDDKEFLHNVLSHFTNGDVAAGSATLTEISGIGCAMFHETREGCRCRTYVLPRGATVLVIRWMTSVDSWDRDLPVFQQTLDTLHVDAAPISE